MGLLTLPDLFRRKYGSLMEVIVSLIEVVSFTCLLAGNLVGTSLLLQFLFGLQLWQGVLIAGIMMASYTIAGGLFSIAYVDIPQVRWRLLVYNLKNLLLTAAQASVQQLRAKPAAWMSPAGNILLLRQCVRIH
jgi:Na+(H+)/acetate symporter ActP